jgi:hypothetical protein
MMWRTKRALWAAAAMVLCLSATGRAQVPAGLFEIERFNAFLDGVNVYGNLDPSRGSRAIFIGLVNTCTGDVVGTAQADVRNASGLPHVYCDSNFGSICGVCVRESLYAVSACGDALLIATGHLCECSPD